MNKKILFALISLFALALFSCGRISSAGDDDEPSQGKAYIQIASSASRTVLPTKLSIDDMTDITLTGKKDGTDASKTLLTADTFAGLSGKTAEIEAGTWSFMLSATIHGVSFSDTTSCAGVEITAGETTSLHFSAMATTATKGDFSVTVTFEGEAKAVTVQLGESILSETDYTLAENALTVTKTNLDAGDYLLKITFYRDTDKTVLLNTFMETVRIAGGQKSSGSYTMNLNDAYTISYDTNGGTCSASLVSSFSRYSTITLPTAETMTRTGYTFAGWYDNADFTGDAITEIPKGSTGNKTLYAKWTAIEYTITYILTNGNLGDGTNASDNPATYTIESDTITLANPTHASSMFAGWYDNAGFTGEAVTQIATGSAGEKTLYARWTSVNSGSTINMILKKFTGATSFAHSNTAPADSDSVSNYLDDKNYIPIWLDGTTIKYYVPSGEPLKLSINSTGFFSGLSALETIDVSGFDTSNINSMYNMFYNCSALTVLDLSSFDTSKVKNMQGMFYNCSALTTLNVSSFNTSSVTTMEDMFNNCSALTALNVSKFDTSKVTAMGSMFYNCSELTVLDLSSFDTSSVTAMYSMFYECNKLTTIYASSTKWNTEKVTSSSSMFSNCTALVGGNGTAYNSSNVTATYAKIDGGTSSSGYFTAK